MADNYVQSPRSRDQNTCWASAPLECVIILSHMPECIGTWHICMPGRLAQAGCAGACKQVGSFRHCLCQSMQAGGACLCRSMQAGGVIQALLQACVPVGRRWDQRQTCQRGRVCLPQLPCHASWPAHSAPLLPAAAVCVTTIIITIIIIIIITITTTTSIKSKCSVVQWMLPSSLYHRQQQQAQHSTTMSKPTGKSPLESKSTGRWIGSNTVVLRTAHVTRIPSTRARAALAPGKFKYRPGTCLLEETTDQAHLAQWSCQGWACTSSWFVIRTMVMAQFITSLNPSPPQLCEYLPWTGMKTSTPTPPLCSIHYVLRASPTFV